MRRGARRMRRSGTSCDCHIRAAERGAVRVFEALRSDMQRAARDARAEADTLMPSRCV